MDNKLDIKEPISIPSCTTSPLLLDEVVKNENAELSIKSLYEIAAEECEKSKPSNEPVFWAKRSCKHCYGRGIEGINTITVQTNKMQMNELCSCARNNFKKWRSAWILQYMYMNKKNSISITQVK